MHIVLVEDNETLAKSVRKVLEHEGYTTTHKIDGEDAAYWLTENTGSYDLVILDVMLPSLDGFSIAKQIREAGINVPIIMLTAKDTVDDTIEGLDSGADDYLKKPFEIDELLARVRSLLRRQPLTPHTTYEVTPGATADMTKRSVFTSAGEVLPLTTKEFAILEYFIHRVGDVLDQQTIYDHVFDFADVQLSNTIEVHIKNIRKKFKNAGYEIPLTTIRGAGYRLEGAGV